MFLDAANCNFKIESREEESLALEAAMTPGIGLWKMLGSKCLSVDYSSHHMYNQKISGFRDAEYPMLKGRIHLTACRGTHMYS